MLSDHSVTPTSRSTVGPSRVNTGMSAGASRRRREKESRTLNYEKAQEFEIWQVARAATAAPFYFEPLKVEKNGASGHIRFTDGGFSHTNNPTRRGQLEIEDIHGSDSIGIVVSVGTARKTRENKSSPWLQFFNMAQRKMKDWVHEMTDPEVVHEDMQHERDKQDFLYYRLNDEEGLDVELDSWEPKQSLFTKDAGSETIETMRNAFAHWAIKAETQHQLRECAETLVECRRKRMRTPKWERFATGARYRCRRHRCQRDLEDFYDRKKFQDHLREHNLPPEQDLEEEADCCKDQWRYQGRSALHAR